MTKVERMPSRILFWDVDTQADFMLPDGRLYVPGSEGIIPALERLTGNAHDHGIRIIASADDHEPGHQELSEHPDYRETFPPHCMRGTPGQRKIPATTLRNPLVIEPDPQDPAVVAQRAVEHPGDILFHKHWFDVFTNPNVLPDVRALEGLIRYRPHTRLYFVTDAARAIYAEQAEHLLKAWGEEGVRLVTTGEIVDEGILDEYLT